MKICSLLLVLFLSATSYSQEPTAVAVTAKDTIAVAFPKPIGVVNDFEEIFTAEQVKELQKIILDFETETGNQIAVVSLNSIGNYESFEHYAHDLSNEWGVGSAGRNNGATLIFSKSLRKIRIATGLGTQEALTDEECKKIIETAIVPEFKKGDFYEGCRKGVLALIKEWK